jgi:hypothetical protein
VAIACSAPAASPCESRSNASLSADNAPESSISTIVGGSAASVGGGASASNDAATAPVSHRQGVEVTAR